MLRVPHRGYTAPQVQGLLDELIAFGSSLPAAEARLVEWRRNNLPSEPPEVFEDVRNLLEYRARPAGHERSLAEQQRLLDEHERSYLWKNRQAAYLLPVGILVVHEHRNR